LTVNVTKTKIGWSAERSGERTLQANDGAERGLKKYAGARSSFFAALAPLTGIIVRPKVEGELRDNIYGHYRSIFN